jgi:hypothetical protein
LDDTPVGLNWPVSQPFYQDEREEALAELKTIEMKYNELKVYPNPLLYI